MQCTAIGMQASLDIVISYVTQSILSRRPSNSESNRQADSLAVRFHELLIYLALRTEYGSLGQAEYVRVPFGSVNLLPIPDDVTDEQALYLSDILPTSLHAVEDTGVNEGDVVGIWVC